MLGEELDLLNWNKGEKREGEGVRKDAKLWINFKNPGGARFIILDAYMRFTDKFLNALRTNVANMKAKQSGQEVIKQTIEEVSGIPFDKYEKLAAQAQKQMIEKYR